jgi:hypothetical protein
MSHASETARVTLSPVLSLPIGKTKSATAGSTGAALLACISRCQLNAMFHLLLGGIRLISFAQAIGQ